MLRIITNNNKSYITNTDEKSPKVGDFCYELKTSDEYTRAVKYIEKYVHDNK